MDYFIFLVPIAVLVFLIVKDSTNNKEKTIILEDSTNINLNKSEESGINNFCNQCGDSLKLDDKFCSECGSKVPKEETSYPLKSVAEENPSPNQKISAIKTKKKESNGIRKFKFFLIYFVIFWIQATLVIFISFTIIGPRPSGLIASGSLFSFWTSYKITKAIVKIF